MCPSIEELKNVWLPFSIQMKMTKNKGLDVCNWTLMGMRCRLLKNWEEEGE